MEAKIRTLFHLAGSLLKLGFMKLNTAKTVLVLCAMLAGYASISQDVAIKIKSEQKQLFSESNSLKALADKVYDDKKEQLKRGIADWLRYEVKQRANKQTMHADEMLLTNSTRLELVEVNNRIFIRYLLPGNTVKFRVTTPDAPGVSIGAGTYADPDVEFSFDAYADFELMQGGTAESIYFINPPEWKITIRSSKGKLLQPTSLSKDDFNDIVKLATTGLQPIYASLNGVDEKVNEYIKTTIKNNKDLQKEFSTDENKDLKVIADVTNSTLIFQHNYSGKGIVKRASSTDANTITEGPRSTSVTSVPVSTSASDVNKKSNVSTTTKPAAKQLRKKG